MKGRRAWTLTCSVAPLVLTASADADVGTVLVYKPLEPYLEYVSAVVNVYVLFDGSDPANNFLTSIGGAPGLRGNVHIDDGFFFQSPNNVSNGGRTAPPFADLALYPELAVDSFVTIGAKATGSPTVGRDSTQLTRGFPTEDGAGQPGGSWGPTILHIDDGAWFLGPEDDQGHVGFADNGPDWVLIGQFSAAAGAGPNLVIAGTLLVQGVNRGRAFTTQLSFHAGIPPTPGTLAVLGAAGLVGRRRRRGSSCPRAV